MRSAKFRRGTSPTPPVASSSAGPSSSTPSDTQRLQSYDWPGNVRELQHVIERAAILSKGRSLELRVARGAHSDRRSAGSRANYYA